MINSETLILEKIGLNIRRTRIASGLSQNQLAFEAGLTREFINKLEAGKLNVSIINLHKIAIVLNISLKDIIE